MGVYELLEVVTVSLSSIQRQRFGGCIEVG